MMRIIEAPGLVKRELKAMCRSKRRRIRKKWLKNPRNYETVPDKDKAYQTKSAIICHPVVAAELRRHVREQARQRPQSMGLGMAAAYGL